jgi:RNA polymerase sigma factor (sigma-70 family)
MNETEFIQLLDKHQGITQKICRLYRDSKEDQEDLMQEIVYQLWKSASSFSGKSKFSSWMYRVALSTAMSTFRKKKVQLTFSGEIPEGPDLNREVDDRSELLFSALKKLNEGDRALITLYMEDLSYEEISEVTGITVNNVGVKLNRIRIKLQSLINQ